MRKIISILIDSNRYINTVLQKISGTESRVIDHSSEVEGISQSIIGFQILVTSGFAFISSYYALFLIFSNHFICAIVSLLYALTIFNIDRVLIIAFVNSLSESERKTQSRKNYIFSMRLILAVFIAFLISIPLELAIFESEIENQIIIDQEENLEKLELMNRVEIDSIYNRYIAFPEKEFQKSDSLIKVEIKTIQEELNNLNNKSVTRRIPRLIKDSIVYVTIYEESPELKEKKSQLNKEEVRRRNQELNYQQKAKSDSISFNNGLKTLEKNLERKKSANNKLGSGIMSRINVMLKIQKEGSYSLVGWMIRLLIILIEVLPTFLKYISKPGEYAKNLAIFRRDKLDYINDILKEYQKISKNKIIESMKRGSED